MDNNSENANTTASESRCNIETPHPPNPSQIPKPPLPLPSRKKRPSKLISSIWDHFTKIEMSANNGERCKCNYCDKDYACDTNTCGTSTLWKHLKNQCKKYSYREQEKGQTTLTLVPSNDGKGGNIGNFRTILFSQEACRMACVKMIIIDELPFRFVENEGFIYFCSISCPKFDIPSRVTIARDVFQLYLEEKKHLKSFLGKNSQRICLTTDTWTSLQNVNYMVLTTHFIDHEWNLHKKILNFCQVANHKGETIGKVIESCLLEWGIDKIFSITVDNASSNGVAISYIKRRLRSWKSIVLDGELLHMRCCAHIINLVVNDGLKDMHDSIASVRNAVIYVRSSPKRLEKFKASAKQAKIECKALVCLDVSTRWNSTYLMLDHALKFEKAFKILEEEKYESDYNDYFEEDGRGNKRLGPPSIQDWDNVKVFVKFLKKFYDVTTKVSGSLYVTSNVGFHKLYNIQYTLIKWSQNSSSILCKMASEMKKKFDKYWGSIEKINKLIFIAMVLDPRYKLEYVSFCFSDVYEEDVAKRMIEGIKLHLIRMYDFYKSHDIGAQVSQAKDISGNDSPQSSSITSIDSSDGEEDESPMHLRYKRNREEKNTLNVKNDLDWYFCEPNEEVKDDFDVLSWWKENGRKFPILSKIAKDVLAVPISTVASESAFSTGGRILDTFRSSLTPKTVEALICTQNWIRGSSKLLDLLPQLEEARGL